MPKVDLTEVANVIRKNEVEPSVLRRILEELNAEAEKKEAAKEEKVPQQKKQFVLLVSDPENKLEGLELAGWALQIPEEDSPLTLMERVCRGAYEFNASKKGRSLPVKSIGETLECVPAKFFKEAAVWVKTKSPVQVIFTDNVLPKDKGNRNE